MDTDVEAVTSACINDRQRNAPLKPRSLKPSEWPERDRLAWEDATRPGMRLTRGGTASHLAEISREDIANRYGLYLDFLRRTGRLDAKAGTAQMVTPANVDAFLTELKARVSASTVWNTVYKLRRALQLIAPGTDAGWLLELEREARYSVRPKDKAGRLVFAHRLLEAGLTLIQEAEKFGRTPFQRARGARNGLMIALLALHPIRPKNFSMLQIGRTFVQIDGRWWISLKVQETKTRRLDERRVPAFMTEIVDRYIKEDRLVLIGQSEGRWLALGFLDQGSPHRDKKYWKSDFEVDRGNGR
jgi:hypothetical protein